MMTSLPIILAAQQASSNRCGNTLKLVSEVPMHPTCVQQYEAKMVMGKNMAIGFSIAGVVIALSVAYLIWKEGD